MCFYISDNVYKSLYCVFEEISVQKNILFLIIISKICLSDEQKVTSNNKITCI